jgi:hypothetical protein
MISTKNITTSFNDIPPTWIFEFYLNLSEKLTGQDIKIKSVFNVNDKTPSMFIYFNKRFNKYMFKDFSTDEGGNAVDLVKKVLNLGTSSETIFRIIKDYDKWASLNSYQIKDFKIQHKYKVTDLTTRVWNKDDQTYWSAYGIDSKLLDHYNVKPLSNYTLSKPTDNLSIERLINGQRLYGYFRSDGVLYKIYQPMVTSLKFLKMQLHIQGIDQLTYDKPYLIICSSLKDIMSFNKLKITNAEAIAPDSENTLIPEKVIESLKSKYKSICTLFDNDEAGIKGMQKYKDRYNLPYAHLKMSKDLSDSIKDHDIKEVRNNLVGILRNTLNI